MAEMVGSAEVGAPRAAPPPSARDSFLKSIRQGGSLGPYRILEPIGEGSFGYVYLAEDSQSMLGTRVALKVPRYQSLSHDELDRYRHEAKLWRALSQDRHPNVLELYNLNRFDGVIAFVMEYVDGANLADFAAEAWRQGPFPLGEAIRIVRAAAEALKVIHAKRVFHGDLKPANILIRKDDGAVKVTDFSISRSVTARGDVPERYFAGTPAYMAPEVWQGRATLQSDLFALGVIFYELVTGARPFQATSAEQLQSLIQHGELRGPASALRTDLPFHIERIILRCLKVAVEDRYASVAELLEDLYLVDTSQDLVTRLAECVLKHSAPDDLAFLVERDLPAKGYRGGDHRSLVIEYCLDEDPQQILLSCFSKAGLARLAERLGAPVGEGYADREQYARAVLGHLGLAGSGSPRGIHDSVRFAANLLHRLEQVRDAADVAGLVTPAVREYEKVVRDLLRFYGQFLYGRFHERELAHLARKRKRLAEHKRDLRPATLGELIGVVQVLNEHLAADSAEAQHFERVFRRRHAVPPALLAQSRVVALRNAFMHGHETLAGAGLSKVRDAARELFNEIVEFLRAIEQEGVYPRIVAVESFVTDHFGRRYVFCRNDQGQLEKVFTNVAVDPSRHYFFYPTTNPMRIYPILVPT
jgi:serine/threonine protein kinase